MLSDKGKKEKDQWYYWNSVQETGYHAQTLKYEGTKKQKRQTNKNLQN